MRSSVAESSVSNADDDESERQRSLSPRATGGSTSIEAPLPTVQEVMSLLNNSALIDGVVGAVPSVSGIGGDVSMADFLARIEDYPSVFPDALAAYYAKQSGVDQADPHLVRLIALLSQKFISDVILDAHQTARTRGLGVMKKGTKEPKFTLTHELLEEVLKEWGIDARKPPYFE